MNKSWWMGYASWVSWMEGEVRDVETRIGERIRRLQDREQGCWRIQTHMERAKVQGLGEASCWQYGGGASILFMIRDCISNQERRVRSRCRLDSHGKGLHSKLKYWHNRFSECLDGGSSVGGGTNEAT